MSIFFLIFSFCRPDNLLLHFVSLFSFSYKSCLDSFMFSVTFGYADLRGLFFNKILISLFLVLLLAIYSVELKNNIFANDFCELNCGLISHLWVL